MVRHLNQRFSEDHAESTVLWANIKVKKHQRHLSVKAHDNITYIPPVAHAVVLIKGGMPSVMISPRAI